MELISYYLHLKIIRNYLHECYYHRFFPTESVVQLKFWNCRKNVTATTLSIQVKTFSSEVVVKSSFFPFLTPFGILLPLLYIPVAYSSWMISAQIRCSFRPHIPFLFFILGNSSCPCLLLCRVLHWGNSSCILKQSWSSDQVKRKCFSALIY